MTNNEIIFEALKEIGFSKNQLAELMRAYRGDLPFHTFQEWKNRGYSVKKGEKAMLSVLLWKFTNKPNIAARKAAAERGEEINEDPHYYKKLSYIFGFQQVRRTGTKEPAAEKVQDVNSVLMFPTIYKPECAALAII